MLSFLRRALAALSFSLLVACAGDDAAPRRVAIFVLDATHAAHVGAYGGPAGITPTLDDLATRSARFARPYSNANWTLPSTACLMTGRLQEQHGVVSKRQRVAAADALLPESFADAGWHTAGYSQIPYASEEYGFGRGFDEFHYYGNGRESERLNGGLTIFEHAGRWMRALEDERWFIYVHLRRPHSPYDPPRKLVQRLDPDGPLSDGSRDAELRYADTFERRSLAPAEVERARVLYRANLMAVDRALAELIAVAEAQDALVIVTSDHGEALGVDDVWGHGMTVAADNVDVPLLVSGPGVVPGVRDEPVATVDLFPTLHELCGLPLPAGRQLAGTSFAPLLAGEPLAAPLGPRLSTGKHGLHGALQVAVVDGPLKLILEADGAVALFDRVADPFERRDLAAERAADVERLAPIARAWAAQHADLIERNRVEDELPDHLRADLERLGYVDEGALPERGAGADGESPR